PRHRPDQGRLGGAGQIRPAINRRFATLRRSVGTLLRSVANRWVRYNPRMGVRILLIEDDDEIADFIVRGLREGGYTVERAADPVMGYGDLRLDLATHRVERAGDRLDLTAKEHALLLFFLRHPGEVLSRTRIYEHVWDERYDGLSNTLEVHVMELRRKLEAHGPRLIHTLRGRGYLFGSAPRSASKGSK